MAKWFYIYDKTASDKKNYFYTENFYESRLFFNPIKPATVTFAKSSAGDWFEIDPTRPSYPLPPMSSKGEHYTTTYIELRRWIRDKKRGIT